MKNKELTKKEMLEYNKLYENSSKKASKLLSAITNLNKKNNDK